MPSVAPTVTLCGGSCRWILRLPGQPVLHSKSLSQIFVGSADEL